MPFTMLAHLTALMCGGTPAMSDFITKRYSKVQCKCQYCDVIFYAYFSDVKRGHGKYCSKDCKSFARRNAIECNCLQCGKKFIAKKAYVDNGKGLYCSNECYGVAQRKNIQCICEYCGETFITKPSRIKEGGGKHCSKACYVKSRESKRDQWGRDGYRGKNWAKQRKLTLIRDDRRCRICGKQKQKKLRIDVHHIRPYRLFEGDYIMANDLSNLITLCRHCHMKVEHGKIPIQLPLI